MVDRSAEVIPAPEDDLCLAYANTRYWRGSEAPTEELNSPEGLLRWAGKMERLPLTLTKRFNQPANIYDAALGVRETIHRCFAATAAGRAPDETDLAALNAALAEAPPRREVCADGWNIGTPAPSVSTLLAPVLWSAADLLVGAQLQRVRQCANPQCGWLFLDNSKSGNRRWCSMSACGNRAKAHRHYLRQKEG